MSQQGSEQTPLNPSVQPKYKTVSLNVNTNPTDITNRGEQQNKQTKPKLSLFNKISLTYINVCNYTQRRALYPFAIYFSTSYNMEATEFAWIISAFHLGGFLAIFISPYINNFKFSVFLFTMLTMLAVTNILMDIWYSFLGLIILRILSGVICTISWSEVTGAVGAFSKAGNERTTGIIITESSFTITTFFYVIIGLILRYLNVTWFWIIMAVMSLFGSFLTCFLPKISLYEAAKHDTSKSKMRRIQSTSSISLIPFTPGEDRISPVPMHSHMRSAVSQDTFPDIDQLQSTKRKRLKVSSSANKDPEKQSFSFMSCIKAYSTMHHLMVHFFVLFFLSAQFSAFSVTFGQWLVDTYNLNAAGLGYFTLANTFGGVTALIITPILGRFKTNLYGIIVGAISIAFMTFFISLLVWIEQNNLYAIVVLFYLYWVASQVMFLNIIVCNLDFSPKGYESTSSLIFQMIARGASFLGTAAGTYVVSWINFPFLINLSCVEFILASLIYIIMYRCLHKSKQYKHLTVKTKKQSN